MRNGPPDHFPAKLLKPAGHRSVLDRRTARRHRPGRMLSAYADLPDGATLPGWVNDLSVKGVSLVLQGPVPAGADLRLTLINEPCTFCISLNLLVVRCSLLMHSTEYFVAGQFDRTLAPDEMLPFLI